MQCHSNYRTAGALCTCGSEEMPCMKNRRERKQPGMSVHDEASNCMEIGVAYPARPAQRRRPRPSASAMPACWKPPRCRLPWTTIPQACARRRSCSKPAVQYWQAVIPAEGCRVARGLTTEVDLGSCGPTLCQRNSDLQRSHRDRGAGLLEAFSDSLEMTSLTSNDGPDSGGPPVCQPKVTARRTTTLGCEMDAESNDSRAASAL